MSCTLGFDADDVLSALDGERGDGERADAQLHVEQCAACREVVRTRTLAKEAWRAALHADDAFTREASERRLVGSWPSARPRPVRPFVFGFATAALAAAAAILLVRAPAQTAWLERRAPAVLHVAPVEAAAPPSTAPEPHVVATKAPLPPAFFVTSRCTTCRIGTEPLPPGATIPPGAKLTVPSGAHVMLGFAFGEGLVDPEAGAEVEGPAVASTTSDGTLSVERGVAQVRAPHEVTVIVPGGRLVAKDASYKLEVTERGTVRVSVVSGTVTLHRTSPPSERTLGPGETATLGEDPAPPAPKPSVVPSPAPPTPAPTALPATTPDADATTLSEARLRARGGDASGLAVLEKLAAAKTPTARRAAFTLAELDLAGGDRANARRRLFELLTAPEDALAFDAATLYARTFTTRADQAEAWRRYLSTLPHSPYRERALLERAEAIFDTNDARRRPEVEALLAEVQSQRLAERETRQLERIRYRLKTAP